MTNKALKGIKSIISLTILGFSFTLGCIPIALDLPPPVVVTETDDARNDACDLLLKVGGTDGDVEKCLTATVITEEDLARLCAASAGLSASDLETLRANLITLDIDINTCEILAAKTTPTPTASPTSEVTSSPATDTTPTTATSTPSGDQTVSPAPTGTPSVEPTPTPTATTGSGGGGGSRSGGGGDSEPDDIPLDVVVDEPTPIPPGITTE